MEGEVLEIVEVTVAVVEVGVVGVQVGVVGVVELLDSEVTEVEVQ